MERRESEISEAILETERRRIERRILLLAVAVPIALGVIGHGLFGLYVPKAVRILLDFVAWPLAACSSLLVSLTLLLSWRYSLRGGSYRTPVVTVLLALTLQPLVYVTVNLWNDPTRHLPTLLWAAGIQLGESAVLVSCALALFVLIRRGMGVCLLRESEKPDARRRPVSVAELFYWMTACAILFAAVPTIAAETQWVQAGSTEPYYMHLLSQVCIFAIPTVLVVLSAPWKWLVRFPMAIGTVYVLSLTEPVMYYLLYRIPLQFQYMPSITGCFLVALGVTFAVWLNENAGYRSVRLGRKVAQTE